jgi:hypothetical protein
MRRKMWASGLCLAAWANAVLAESPPVRTGTLTNRDTATTVHSYGDVEWVPGATTVAPSDEAFAVGRTMARCAVDKQPDRVRRFLAARDRSDFGAALKPLQSTLGTCMINATPDGVQQARFSFQPMFLAGLLAEAWLLKHGISALAPAVLNANAPKLDWLATSAATLVQLRLSECLVTRQPAHVAPFVAARPATPAELAGFRALAPLVPTCLDKDVTLQAKRTPIKLAMAFAYYRRSAVPEVAAQ